MASVHRSRFIPVKNPQTLLAIPAIEYIILEFFFLTHNAKLTIFAPWKSEQSLADFTNELHIIGDCLTPRTVEEAILEGLKAGTSV